MRYLLLIYTEEPTEAVSPDQDDELDALKFLQGGFSERQIFYLSLRNSRRAAAARSAGRSPAGRTGATLKAIPTRAAGASRRIAASAARWARWRWCAARSESRQSLRPGAWAPSP